MREVRILGLTALAGLVGALVVAPSPARANCYENFGRTNSQYFEPTQLKQASCQGSVGDAQLDLQGERLLLPYPIGDQGLR